MKVKLLGLGILLIAFNCVISAPLLATESTEIDLPTTVYLIRHAEKELGEIKDPALTELGRLRAKHWANFFTSVELDRIYSTDTLRTRDTAKVVASSQDQKIVLYDVKTIDSQEFLQQNVGKSILVVGHSNTIPEFTNALIGAQRFSDLDESEYSKVFVVDIVGNSKQAKILTLELTRLPTKETGD